MIRDTMNSTTKIKKSTLAIPAALAATPPNPKIAAIIATTRNITVQRNIIERVLDETNTTSTDVYKIMPAEDGNSHKDLKLQLSIKMFLEKYNL
jgi:hypothetical protein